jgi:hypothetical protein
MSFVDNSLFAKELVPYRQRRPDRAAGIADGRTQIFLKAPSRRIFALVTQLSATPPGRQRLSRLCSRAPVPSLAVV